MSTCIAVCSGEGKKLVSIPRVRRSAWKGIADIAVPGYTPVQSSDPPRMPVVLLAKHGPAPSRRCCRRGAGNCSPRHDSRHASPREDSACRVQRLGRGNGVKAATEAPAPRRKPATEGYSLRPWQARLSATLHRSAHAECRTCPSWKRSDATSSGKAEMSGSGTSQRFGKEDVPNRNMLARPCVAGTAGATGMPAPRRMAAGVRGQLVEFPRSAARPRIGVRRASGLGGTASDPVPPLQNSGAGCHPIGLPGHRRD